ncbi:MAG: hypothetical protein KA712_08215 [Myxococcales bacterium]|nr:hypothetical protein [Myxococcales bacterium]
MPTLSPCFIALLAMASVLGPPRSAHAEAVGEGPAPSMEAVALPATSSTGQPTAMPASTPDAWVTPAASPRPGPTPPQMLAIPSPVSPVAALAIEWFIPGGGSVYADNGTGAVTTWMLLGAGIASLLLVVSDPFEGSEARDMRLTGAVFGAGLLAAGRVHGLVDAYTSAQRTQTLALELQASPW